MRIFRIAIILIMIFSICPVSSGEAKDFARWGNLMDVAYKFTWYPTSDLKDLIKAKSGEYGASLDEYSGFLIDELTQRASKSEYIAPESFITGKDWKMYYRLAIAQFCLFLVNEKITILYI